MDPLHYYLLQSDIDEFAPNKSGIYDKLLDTGDTELGTLLYHRYQQRFDESIAAVNEALKKGDFKFDGNDSIEIDRKKAPAPKTIEDAKKLWIQIDCDTSICRKAYLTRNRQT